MSEAATDNAVDRAAAILQIDEHAVDKARLAEVQALGERIVDQLKTVYDPEIPVNIYELGLVYKVDVEDDNKRPDRHDPDLAALPGRGDPARPRSSRR